MDDKISVFKLNGAVPKVMSATLITFGTTPFYKKILFWKII